MAKLIGTDPNQVPTNGDLGTMAYQDYDVVAPQLLAGRRNLIINGAMQVAQRGTSFTGIGNTAFTLDRWEVYPGANPGVITVTQETFDYNDDMLVNEGFTNYLRSEVTTPLGATSYDNRFFRYPIEDVRLLAGKEVTISFWAKASSPTKMGVETRNYDGATISETKYLSPYDAPDGNEFNITTSWQRFTHTFTIPALTTAITGDAASTYTKVFLLADTNTANLQHDITGVQLEVGSVATPFEHRSYGEELALCERYYQVLSLGNGAHIGNGSCANATMSRVGISHNRMRVAPTVTLPPAGQSNGTITFLNGSTGYPTTTGTHAVTSQTPTSFRVNGNSYSGLNGGYSSWFYSTGETEIKLDAEL